MKAIGKVFIGCMAWAATFAASTSLGSPHGIAHQMASGIWAVGQVGSNGNAARRREANELLKLARQAIEENEFELAEKHLERAEQLNVQYDSLFAPFQDTPQKIRRDLQKKRSGDRPSSRFSPLAPSREQKAERSNPPQDPFTAAAGEQALETLTGNSKSEAQAYLQRGRNALKKNDLPGAVAWWQKAVATGARFRSEEYSPENLETELRQAGVDARHLKPPAADAPFDGGSPAEISQDGLRRLPPVSPERTSRPGMMPQSAITDPNKLPASANPLLDHDGSAKSLALRLVAQARAALDRGDYSSARRLGQQAADLKVPDREFAGGETRPWEVLLEVDKAVRRGVAAPMASEEAVKPAVAEDSDTGQFPVSQGLYNPQNDPTRNELAQNVEPAPSDSNNDAPSPGQELYQQGLRALEAQQRDEALELFRQAWQYQEELDLTTRRRLKDKLSLLNFAPAEGPPRREPSPLEEVNTQQNLLRQKLFSEVLNEGKAAEQMLQSDPKEALARLERLRERVAQAELDPEPRKQLLTLVDRSLGEVQSYIDTNASQIAVEERNREIRQGIQQDRNRKFEVQDKVAELVDQFNELMEEERFAEAEVVGKQVRELDPDSPYTRLLMLKSKTISRLKEQQWIDDLKEEGFHNAMTAVDQSGVPFDDRQPLQFGPVKNWEELSRTRREWKEQQQKRLSPAELEIKQKLQEKVEVRFTGRPLVEVLETLGSMVGVNIYPDLEGMAAEGVTSETPVNINLTQPVSLQSALNLILEPLRLSYVIQHEVLRITSEQARDANVYTDVYHVADLIVPIPNFTPGYNVGLPSAIREAHRAMPVPNRYGGDVQPVSTGPLTVSQNELDPNASLNSSVLAQSNGLGMLPGSSDGPSSMPLGSPSREGGAALADFDSLIELITATIAPESWDTVGGPGAIEPFPLNLSLVVSQTQDVHDQLADLLEQLRRLQDLQVTIEVRFITLQDFFFERIGIDFDFDVDDNVQQLPPDDSGNSVTIGLDETGNPTADFDLSFNQGSFGLTTPPFGSGAQALAGAGNFGFAILSDIEAFFLLQAAQGDTRSNVLQAPKVTLFNGQQASVSDTSQRPFVTSLVPVVGDFAAAHQPVIVVLNEGTSLSVQAVVSSDRRFVRLTLVPVFSQIGNVEEFTFQGSTTTDSGTNIVDEDGDVTGETDNESTTKEGTTVQLPTFSFTTVSTTVSVPDGGTILLGGIKRLREGRNESGIPMLSKLPYLNRLFRNVGIGRETQSLMLMVTPRIIIQEEEEERLGID